jgi:serine phosphatase RsbU (regulator of sigma subunit)
MAMGHFETRLTPVEVPAFAAIAERLNMMADQAQLLQQAQIEGTAHTSRMAQELQDAQIVQQTLMPDVRRISRGALQLCGVYRSASKLSGDWWHYYPLDEHRTMLVMADVVGHGIGSAVVGAMAYGCAQQLHKSRGRSCGQSCCCRGSITRSIRRFAASSR